MIRVQKRERIAKPMLFHILNGPSKPKLWNFLDGSPDGLSGIWKGNSCRVAKVLAKGMVEECLFPTFIL